jgi:hypothetical protein
MAVKVDYLLQDANALQLSIDNNRAAMNAKGFTEATYNGFIEAKNTLNAKESAQQKAVKLVSSKTAEQDSTIERITNLIKKVRSAAKSAYGKDERNLKRFKCDEKIPTTVAKLLTTCQYLAGLALETHDLLLENGFIQTDIDELNASYGDLTAVDAAQENAKKLQVAATTARDEAAGKLTDKMFRVRNFAKACFAGNAELLAQFKSIPKGRGAGGNSDEEKNSTPPITPTTPAT